MCKRHVETSQSTNVTVIILRCRTHSRLGRKSGYFKRWLEYSNEFEALKASEKLNIVLLSWERTCWTTLIQSCDEKRVVDVFHVGHWAQVRKTDWTKDTLKHPKPCQFIASRNHSLVELTESKGNSTVCKARNCSHVQVDVRPYNEENVTVRNKTFIYRKTSGAPNENIIQNHLNIALLNVF